MGDALTVTRCIAACALPAAAQTRAALAFTAGGGVRVPAGARGTFGLEARMGWEAHLRVNAVFGWRLGPAS